MRRCECEPEELASQLLWTWFVDNPRPGLTENEDTN
jgi:hypothetical protein